MICSLGREHNRGLLVMESRTLVVGTGDSTLPGELVDVTLPSFEMGNPNLRRCHWSSDDPESAVEIRFQKGTVLIARSLDRYWSHLAQPEPPRWGTTCTRGADAVRTRDRLTLPTIPHLG